MPQWHDYMADKDPGQHTVVGELRVLHRLHSPQLHNARDVYVYLPPSYWTEPDRRYPVLYMHDGQNLFDRAQSYVGEWEVDETMERLAEQENVEAIVVGIANSGRARIHEYSPFDSPRFGEGRGERYLDFLLQTVKPRIDADFRTLKGRQHTAIMGSSMGGLISLYAFFRHPEVFGLAGVLSPSLWFAHGQILQYVAESPAAHGRLYLDVGKHELSSWANRVHYDTANQRYVATAHSLRDLLRDKGYRVERDLYFVEDPEGTHHETSWARRFPDAVRFLLGS